MEKPDPTAGLLFREGVRTHTRVRGTPQGAGASRPGSLCPLTRKSRRARGARAGPLRGRAAKARGSMAVYAAAAAVLAGVESRQGSIKGLVYGSRFQVAGGRVRALVGWVGSRAAPLSVRALGPAQNVKQLYALVCETQRYSAVLDAVIASAGLLGAEKKLRPHLAKVMGGVGL